MAESLFPRVIVDMIDGKQFDFNIDQPNLINFIDDLEDKRFWIIDLSNDAQEEKTKILVLNIEHILRIIQLHE
jgi:hypothetical protein